MKKETYTYTPFIGRRFVQNLPECRQRAAQAVREQHFPLMELEGHPSVPYFDGEWTVGATLWDAMSQAQDAAMAAHRPLVDWAVEKYAHTADPDIRQRLVYSGYAHRVDVVDLYLYREIA